MPKTVAGNVPCDMAALSRLMNDPESRYQRTVARAAHELIVGTAREKTNHHKVFARLASGGSASESDRGAVVEMLSAAFEPEHPGHSHGVVAVLQACPRVIPAAQKRLRW